MVLTILDRLIRGFASAAREELEQIAYKLLSADSKYKNTGDLLLSWIIYLLFCFVLSFSFFHFSFLDVKSGLSINKGSKELNRKLISFAFSFFSSRGSAHGPFFYTVQTKSLWWLLISRRYVRANYLFDMDKNGFNFIYLRSYIFTAISFDLFLFLFLFIHLTEQDDPTIDFTSLCMISFYFVPRFFSLHILYVISKYFILILFALFS